MKNSMPFLWRIPIRFTVNERHFPPILIQNILYQKPARSAIPPPRKKEKSTRTSPSAFPTVLRRCRSRWDRRTAVRRIKFPIKVQLCRTFIPLPRDTYPRAPSLALRAIHLVPSYMIQFVKWFNVYTIMITIYRRAGWPYPAVCKFSCTIKIVGEHIVLPHQC